MAVNSTHPSFDDTKYEKCEDCYEGDIDDFIPRLKGQTNQEYQAYVNRASFFNVTERTCAALVGITTRKSPTLSEPDITLNTSNGTFEEFLVSTFTNILLGSRVGVLVDFNESTQQPYLTLYNYPNIINWSDSYIVLREKYYTMSPKDKFEHIEVVQYRELTFDENGFYIVNLWRQDGKKFVIVDTLEPSVFGKRLTYLPFTPINHIDTSFSEFNPPLFTLANLNIEHFRLSVDFAHGLHFTALPQPYISGDFAGEVPNSITIGSPTVWQLTQGSQVGYLEFTGTGLGLIQKAITDKQSQMSVVGSRLLEQDKKGIEAADTIAIKTAGEHATLVGMVTAVESGLNQALETYGLWLGQPLTITFSKDFTPTMNVEQVKLLLASYQQGTMSLETLIEQMYKNELINDVALEKQRLNITTT